MEEFSRKKAVTNYSHRALTASSPHRKIYGVMIIGDAMYSSAITVTSMESKYAKTKILPESASCLVMFTDAGAVFSNDHVRFTVSEGVDLSRGHRALSDIVCGSCLVPKTYVSKVKLGIIQTEHFAHVDKYYGYYVEDCRGKRHPITSVHIDEIYEGIKEDV